MNFNSYHDIGLLSRFFLLISKVLIRNKLNYQESYVYYCQRYAYELADSHYVLTDGMGWSTNFFFLAHISKTT